MDLRIEDGILTFWLRVKPQSSRQRLTTDSSGELRLELHAAATEGHANEAAIEFLADALRVPKGCISIVTGEKSRRKLLRVSASAPVEIAHRLQNLAAVHK